ncbi:hypothetical protein QVZ41_07880 [Wenyingzhuangia sp. chi5]|uniref:DUF4249 domain-containing protein n=1 Tax=Wenyingzhuangia gilva TaxID=3057677 RepID=A0ABT8VS08_9FLAO|nr:hypothetical protein [Wenyingzhuangia sp. chi5]MDO3694758.1 hypothetical protein [Wenyingzhuangia sp. chi5]
MKKYIYLLFLILTTISCTEEIVIDDLDNVDPRLVIEASIDINKYNNSYKTQTIKLSQTTSYYSNKYPQVKNAVISVTDENGNSMGTFLDVNPAIPNDEEDGVYTAVDFTQPNLGDKYFLSITVDGETYTAEDTYTGIVDINEINQQTISFGDDIIQINVNIDNEIGVDNYYLTKIDSPFRIISEYGSGNDEEFTEEPGKNNFDVITYIDEELEKDMKIDISLYGISKNYQNYLSKLFLIAQGSNGPFSTAPASVRGNILNTTNQDNYALGYFSVNQFIKTSYTVE